MNQLFLYKLLQFGSISILHLQSTWVKWNKLLLKWSCLQQAKEAKKIVLMNSFYVGYAIEFVAYLIFMTAWGRFLVGKLNIHIETFSCSIASVELITVTGVYCITLIEAACQDDVQVICIAHYEKVVGIAASQQPCWLLCRWHDYNSYSVWVWCTIIIIFRKQTDVKIIVTFLMNYYYSVEILNQWN